MTTATNKPVPSSDPRDLLFNAQKIDEAVNGPGLEYLDRFGVPRETLAGAIDSIKAINVRGAWATATGYHPKDVVSNGGSWYISVTTHNSGATFAGDMSANWRVYQGVLASDLSDKTSAGKAAGMVSFSDALDYPQGSVGIALRGRVDVKAHPYNAAGDGVSDDTEALITAEAAALSSGRELFLPGGIYCFNGTFTTRVNIQGYGATIKQVQASIGVNITLGTVAAGANGITIIGLTVDGGLKTSGFTSDGKSYLTYRDCYAINCVNLGFGNYGGTRIDLWACRTTNTRYQSTGTPSLPADGFYFGGCTRSRWIGCSADDFRRIGFVSEGNGSAKSAQIQAQFCLASNANNCDDSTTEYNSGFWAENTNSIDWLHCIASDIATGVGQSSGRVVGMIPIALGNNSRGNVNVIGCRVFGGANRLPIAMQISGSGIFADVNIQDCYLNRAQTGIANLCGMNSLTIRNLSMEDVVNANAGNGGIVVDASLGGLLPILEIDKLTATNATWDANSGIVNFFNAPLACNYTLRNVKGGHPHVMRGRIAKLRAEECVIAAGATGYSSFLAGEVSFVDCDFTSRNSATTDQIVGAGALASGSTVMFRGGSVTGYGAGWAPDFSGTDITTRCFGTKFDKYCWDISTTGTFDNEFNDCLFLNVPATVGSVRTNTASATKQVLSILGGKAKSNNVADIPFRKRSGGADPTVLCIQGVGYTTGVTLHNFTNAAPPVANNYTM